MEQVLVMWESLDWKGGVSFVRIRGYGVRTQEVSKKRGVPGGYGVPGGCPCMSVYPMHATESVYLIVSRRYHQHRGMYE